MAPMAFVFINTETGKEEEAVKDLRKIRGVEEAYAVYGVYDVVAKVYTPTMDSLKEVKDNIRGKDYIRSTLTMIATEGFKKSRRL